MLKLLFFFIISHSDMAQASPFGFNKGTFFGFVEGSYLSTKANFDSSSNITTLPTSNKFIEYKLDMQGSYDITNSWGFYTGVNFKRVESLGNPIERANSGFSTATLGSDFLLWGTWINIIPDISIVAPVHKLDIQSAFLDDNAASASFKTYASKEIGPFYIGGYGGYTYRVQGLSASIPWGAFIHIDISDFFVDAKVNGEKSLSNDQLSNSTDSRLISINNFNAGSYIYRSPNPTYLDASLRLGFKLTPGFLVTGSIESRFLGQNTYSGTRFLVGLGLVLPEPKRETTTKTKETTFTPLGTQDADPSEFKEETDTAPELIPVEISKPGRKPYKKITPVR